MPEKIDLNCCVRGCSVTDIALAYGWRAHLCPDTQANWYSVAEHVLCWNTRDSWLTNGAILMLETKRPLVSKKKTPCR